MSGKSKSPTSQAGSRAPSQTAQSTSNALTVRTTTKAKKFLADRKKLNPETSLTTKNKDKAPKKGDKVLKKKPEVKPKYPKAIANAKGKWGERARALMDVLKDNNVDLKGNPLARFALTLCLFMGKYAGYIDYFPGNFRKSLDEGDYKDENFDKIQKARLREQRAKKFPKKMHEFIGIFDTENAKRTKERKPKLDYTEASTFYVSYLLFAPQPSDPKKPAVNYITDHKILAARLAHEHTDVKNEKVFGDSTLSAMKKMKQIPRGTVIFFLPNYKTGIIPAYYNGDAFVYFDQKTKKRKTFKLGAPNSPVKNDLNLSAAFVPTHLEAAVKPATTTTTKTPARTPGKTPAKAPTTTPSALSSSVTTTVDNVEKQLRIAIKQTNPLQKYKKIADILATSIIKIEDAIEKGTPQLFDLYPKLKEKYDMALNKYYGLIVEVIKIRKRELEGNKKRLKASHLKLKAEQAKVVKDKKAIAKLEVRVKALGVFENIFVALEPFMKDVDKYLKRAKECLPKSISK